MQQKISPEALAFLRHRRSHPPRTLTGPPPSQHEIENLLTLAARVPDHGKLGPWRFIVIQRESLDRLAPWVAQKVAETGGDAAAVEKARAAFDSPLVVAVVSAPVEDSKIPRWEQELSAGAVCLSLVNAALAAGFGAAWLTGPAAQDDFARAHLGLDPAERVAGLIHIGRRTVAEMPDRPRPDLPSRTTWLA